MNLVLAGLFLLTILIGFVLNSDLFSPAKLLLVSVGVVFFDIFISEYQTPVIAVFLGILALITAVTWMEVYMNRQSAPWSSAPQTSLGACASNNVGKVAAILWIATLIPVAAQIGFIAVEGGLQAYINALQLRVENFRGLGYFLSLTATIYPINLFYFGFGLISKPPRRWWYVYALHLGIQILIALLSSSRSLIVIPLAQLVMTFHFLRKPVKLAAAAAVGAALLMVVALIGAARDGYRVTSDGQFQTGLSKSFINLEHFKYGLLPLDLVFSQEVDDPKYGLTFATIVTTYIPRNWWPEKPDTGGVVITREFLNDRWHGRNYITPGLIAESILNFDRAAGTIVGFALFALMMAIVTRMYASVRYSTLTASYDDLQRVVRYVCVVFPIVSLASGEFTNSMLPMINTLIVLSLLNFAVANVTGLSRLAHHYA